MFIGRTNAEAETPILWPPDAESWLIGKAPDAKKDWRREEKRTTEDEMVGRHHRLSGHGFGWTPGVGYGQGSLACCSSWGCKESDMTEQLNWTELNWMLDLKKIYHDISREASISHGHPCLWGLPVTWETCQISHPHHQYSIPILPMSLAKAEDVGMLYPQVLWRGLQAHFCTKASEIHSPSWHYTTTPAPHT